MWINLCEIILIYLEIFNSSSRNVDALNICKKSFENYNNLI